MKQIIKYLPLVLFVFIVNHLNGQDPIDPGYPTISGSISGPSGANCNSPAVYTFEPGFGYSCDKVSWTVLFPNGQWEYYSGQSIEIETGSQQGTLSVFAFAKAKDCTIYANINAGTTTDVGIRLSTPSSLSGSSYLCNSTASSYTVSSVPHAMNYKFSVPPGWKINNIIRTTFTSTSRTVTITAPSSGKGSGVIRVKANPAPYWCGPASLERTRTVNYGRQTPSITASSTQIPTNGFGSFSSSGIGLSDYQWRIPSDWGAPSGLNDQSLSVVTGNTPGYYVVEVTAKNCGITVGNFINITVVNGSRDPFFSEFNLHSNSDLSSDILTHPNPVNEELHITIPNESIKIASISLINASDGEEVFNQVLDNAQPLDFSKIEEGVYILNIITVNNDRVQKRIQIDH